MPQLAGEANPQLFWFRKGNDLLQVILVRHGETDWNKSHRIQGGGSDTRLNGTGKEQAAALALRLKPEKIEAIYSSPLKRALDTARAIAHHHQLEIEIEPALREVNVGELEGTPARLLGKRLDELLGMRGQDKTQTAVWESVWSKIQHIGGESLAELQQRTWDALKRIVDRHSDGVIVVVSHGFVIVTIICAVLDLPLSQMNRLRVGVGSISTIMFDNQVTRLMLFNDSCHLVV